MPARYNRSTGTLPPHFKRPIGTPDPDEQHERNRVKARQARTREIAKSLCGRCRLKRIRNALAFIQYLFEDGPDGFDGHWAAYIIELYQSAIQSPHPTLSPMLFVLSNIDKEDHVEATSIIETHNLESKRTGDTHDPPAV